MAQNSYTGFGSQIVLEPQSMSLFDTEKNANDSVKRWRKKKLQLRYFTIRSHPEDTINNVYTNGFREKECFSDSADEFYLEKNEELLVIETKSCESFHSCHSSTSNFSMPPKDSGKMKVRHQCNRNKSSKEEFVDQITVINAIFLNNKSYETVNNAHKHNKYEKENENLLNEKTLKVPDTSAKVQGCSFKTDKSSGDRTSVQACINCKCPVPHKQIENTAAICNKTEEHQEPFGIKRTKTYDKLSTNNSGFKTFKINKKTIHGTKKPFISKLVSRKGHQSMVHKLQSLKRSEIKSCPVNMQTNETPHSTEDNDELHTEDDDELHTEDDELHKGLLLQWKQEVSEGYEIHFLEPILMTNYSISFGSVSTPEDSNTDVISGDKETNSQNHESNTNDSCNDSEKSFFTFFEFPNDSDTCVQLSKELMDTETNADCGSKISHGELNQNSEHVSDLNLELTEGPGFLSDTPCEQDNFTVLYESDTNLSDLSNETSETLSENEDWPEKTDNEHLITATLEVTGEENTTVNKSEENEKQNTTEQSIEVEDENVLEAQNNRTSCVKRRRSSSRKCSLPVIEESPEPTHETSKADLLDNDYCLVDTLGRPIHLFDFRGWPLTDGSGRPLRSAVGELLLKCDDKGIPVVDEETQIFDMFGTQPHEEGFQPWMCPWLPRTIRLTLRDGRPFVLFDVEGRPLTSISGTMLVDSCGRGLLNHRNCLVQSTFHD